jgi:hypothetical protein
MTKWLSHCLWPHQAQLYDRPHRRYLLMRLSPCRRSHAAVLLNGRRDATTSISPPPPSNSSAGSLLKPHRDCWPSQIGAIDTLSAIYLGILQSCCHLHCQPFLPPPPDPHCTCPLATCTCAHERASKGPSLHYRVSDSLFFRALNPITCEFCSQFRAVVLITTSLCCCDPISTLGPSQLLLLCSWNPHP